jgi:hypothetical protein
MTTPFFCNRLRAGWLPCLPYIDERPDRNSMNGVVLEAQASLQDACDADAVVGVAE